MTSKPPLLLRRYSTRSALAALGVFVILSTPAQAVERDPKMSYLDNGTIRVGVDLNLGGSITYISKAGTDRNIVNNHDWGRQIQMSFYGGPNPFVPEGASVAPHWKQLGWNPIQSGDYAGNRSIVTKHANDGETLSVESIPMHWPLENVPGQCRFETEIRLDGNKAHVVSRLRNRREDKTQYRGRSQELPAIYTIGPLHRLISYTGDRPFMHDGPIEIRKPADDRSSFPWVHFDMTEHWAALVDEDDWGLGVYTPETAHALGGFHGHRGQGGPDDNPTGYIAPIAQDVLDHNIVYEYRYTLILGTLDEIRGYAYHQQLKHCPPSYVFSDSRKHWTYHNAQDTGWPIRGELRIEPTGPGAHCEGPREFWRAEDAPTLYVEAAFDTGETTARVFWRRHGQGFTPKASMPFKVESDGEHRVYAIDLSQSPEYTGLIGGLRISLANGSRDATIAQMRSVRIRSIGFERPVKE